MNTQKLNLLILEDNPDHAELIIRELKKKGFVLEWKRVETKEAFKEALAEKPDIILSDYNLPSFDGMDAIKIHQILTPEIPLIIVSDMMSGDLAVECIKAGATDYVHKKELSRLNPVVKRALKETEAYSERKKAEESLKESEKKYRTLFESSRDAIMMLAPPNWEFIAGNRATVEMFKAKDEKEFTSKGPGEISPEYQPDGQLSGKKAVKMIKKAIKNGSHFFEWTHKRSNGEEFPATVLLTRMEMKSKKLLQATVRDITERKQAEQEVQRHRDHLQELIEERTSELRKSEKKYRTLTENLNVGVFRNTVGSKGKFIEINPALINIFGYKYKKEIFKLNVSHLYQNPEERKKFNLQILKNGFVKDYEINLTKKDGSILIGSVSAVGVKDKNGNMKFYDGVIDDITERKQAEDTLNRNLQQQKLLTEVSYILTRLKNIRKNINKALGLIGEYTKVSRVYVFEDFSNGEYTKNIYEWCNKNIESQIDNLQEVHYKIIPSLKKILNEKGMVFSTDILELPQDLIEIVEPQKIKSIIIFPVYVNNKFFGFMGFDECIENRIWDKSEIELLKTVVNIISNLFERNKAEIELKESEEKYRNLTATAQDTIIMMDNDGNISYWNEAAEKMFGHTKEEIIGKEVHKLITPTKYYDDYAKGFEVFRKTGKGPLIGKTIELTGLKKDGTEFPIELSLSALKLKGKWNATAIIRDITERKQAEETLKKQTKKLEVLNQIIKTANKAEDIQSLLENILKTTLQLMNFDGGGIYLANHTDRTATLHCSINLPPDQLKDINKIKIDKKPFDTIFIKGELIITEHYEKINPQRAKKWQIKSLASIPFVSKDKIVGAMNVISKSRYSFSNEEKELLQSIGREIGTAISNMIAENEMYKSEKKYRTLTETATDIIFTVNINGEITYLSPAFEKATGYPCKDYIGHPFIELLAPEYIESTIDRFKRGLAGEKTPLYEIEVIHKDKGTVPVELNVTSLQDINGKITGRIGITRDITERKQAQDELKNYANTQKVLLQEVNHRVKNNLTAILGLLQIEEVKIKNKDYLNFIYKFKGRIYGLSTVHSLLAKNNWQPLNLNLLCNKIINASIDCLHCSKISNIDISHSTVMISSNQAYHLTLIITELITNSLKYGQKNKKKIRINVDIKKNKENIIITFRDTGKGYPKALIEKNFNDTGVGLDLIKGIVTHSLNGELQIYNDDGAVTVFKFKPDEEM